MLKFANEVADSSSATNSHPSTPSTGGDEEIHQRSDLTCFQRYWRKRSKNEGKRLKSIAPEKQQQLDKYLGSESATESVDPLSLWSEK